MTMLIVLIAAVITTGAYLDPCRMLVPPHQLRVATLTEGCCIAAAARYRLVWAHQGRFSGHRCHVRSPQYGL